VSKGRDDLSKGLSSTIAGTENVFQLNARRRAKVGDAREIDPPSSDALRIATGILHPFSRHQRERIAAFSTSIRCCASLRCPFESLIRLVRDARTLHAATDPPA